MKLVPATIFLHLFCLSHRGKTKRQKWIIPELSISPLRTAHSSTTMTPNINNGICTETKPNVNSHCCKIWDVTTCIPMSKWSCATRSSVSEENKSNLNYFEQLFRKMLTKSKLEKLRLWNDTKNLLHRWSTGSMISMTVEDIIKCVQSFKLLTASSITINKSIRSTEELQMTLYSVVFLLHAKQSWSCRWSFLLRLSASII